MKKILGITLFAASCAIASAQSGTNSPYSRFGLGLLSEQTSGFSRGMNGLGLAFHDGNQVNYLNPASYARMDSLTFMFDAGLSLHITNFSENGTKRNANNANIEYIVAGFRAGKHLGVSFGLIPYTNVGYNYSTTHSINSQTDATYTNTYDGSGGLHQAYLGVGWEPLKGFAVGANFSYLWGGYDRSFLNSYSDASTKSVAQYYNVDVRNYKVDFGAQYTHNISAKDYLTLAVTFSPGHKIGGNPTLNVISQNSQTGVADTTAYGGDMKLSIPTSFGVGVMWEHNQKWKIGADYTLQKWASLQFPDYVVSNNVASFAMQNNMLSDRHKVTVGGEFSPATTSRNFFSRVKYRAGVSYATPYVKVNGSDGPKEMSASLGFGIPIINTYNNRSILNVSAQWVHSSAKNYISENIFRINVGLTFNERWFMKWKVE